jgi:hypothetical protein
LKVVGASGFEPATSWSEPDYDVSGMFPEFIKLQAIATQPLMLNLVCRGALNPEDFAAAELSTSSVAHGSTGIHRPNYAFEALTVTSSAKIRQRSVEPLETLAENVYHVVQFDSCKPGKEVKSIKQTQISNND